MHLIIIYPHLAVKTTVETYLGEQATMKYEQTVFLREGVSTMGLALDLLADTLENSPWYWNNWNNQSAQFLSQGDTSYFNPHFVDNWAQSPMKMRIGQSMQSFSHAWSANDDTGEQSAKLNYPSSWSTRQIGQHVLSLATGSTYDPSQEEWSSIPVGNLRSSQGSGYITASTLRGIALDTTNYATALGLTAWDAARAQQDIDNGIGPKNLVNRWVKDTGLGQGRMHENQQEETI